MKERPILFSAPMVQALLDGRKTQTRRVVKLRGKDGVQATHDCWRYLETDSLTGNQADRRNGGMHLWQHRTDIARLIEERCPYGQPGDRLWVRETHLRATADEIHFRADGDFPEGAAKMLGGWRPSIFMPRKFSRILLEITAVRAERLQDISEADCYAEGVEHDHSEIDHIYWVGDYFGEIQTLESAVACYKILWETINGAGSWDANPFVWAIEFKRIGQ
ncbi:hypothetical protein SAMN05216428_102310 [Nitrosospira sp. Nsp11]|uniref:hypothetical protein n=1 Tax=Nitrosospira sp. Nsp11 TaxID=1855338 RepID=UPI0009153FEA|nr:hypothetical protein [Nitrosospira sp. Nsp11]SHL40894.1 hypothetical protein SAMN05216428_102310 [Nitrosospira sp. Nsp11]